MLLCFNSRIKLFIYRKMFNVISDLVFEFNVYIFLGLKQFLALKYVLIEIAITDLSLIYFCNAQIFKIRF